MAAHSKVSSTFLEALKMHLVNATGGGGGGGSSGTKMRTITETKIEDTNVAGIGSAADKNLRKEAAMKEPAWHNAGVAPGVQVWRIEKFQIKEWPKEEYGKFHEGDSYIIVNTKEDKSTHELHWDVHFWLGDQTSDDEAGTAAYKSVEFDSLKDDKAIQHREVQNHETEKFLSYFKPAIQILQGGIDGGFRHVKAEDYKPRLLRVCKVGKEVKMTQVPLRGSSLNQGDVFILDSGLTLYQFNGDHSSPFERQKAAAVIAQIDADRMGKPVRGEAPSAAFWATLGGECPIPAEAPADATVAPPPTLWKLSDAGGSVTFTKVADAPLNMSMLSPADVNIVDSGTEVFAWIGRDASNNEAVLAMPYAMKYLEDNGRPRHLPITKLVQGGENSAFKAVVA